MAHNTNVQYRGFGKTDSFFILCIKMQKQHCIRIYYAFVFMLINIGMTLVFGLVDTFYRRRIAINNFNKLFRYFSDLKNQNITDLLEYILLLVLIFVFLFFEYAKTEPIRSKYFLIGRKLISSLQFCLFICQAASARRQRVKLPPVTYSLTIQS